MTFNECLSLVASTSTTQSLGSSVYSKHFTVKSSQQTVRARHSNRMAIHRQPDESTRLTSTAFKTNAPLLSLSLPHTARVRLDRRHDRSGRLQLLLGLYHHASTGRFSGRSSTGESRVRHGHRHLGGPQHSLTRFCLHSPRSICNY